MCKKKIKKYILKKWPCFGVLKVEKCQFSSSFRPFLHFPDFFIFSCLGRSKSVLGSFFAFLTKNWPKNIITPPKPHIFILTFTWPSDIEWHWPWICSPKALANAKKCPRHDTCRCIGFFPFHTALVCDKSRYSKSSNILTLTWPVTSSVTPRLTTLGFPRQIVQIYRTPFGFCRSDQ